MKKAKCRELKEQRRIAKQKKKKQRQRLRQLKQLATILRHQWLKQKTKRQRRKVIPYNNKHGMHLFKFDPPFNIQQFKAPQGWWRPVRTCRLQGLQKFVFNIKQYVPQKNYFILTSKQRPGTHYYNLQQLEPVRRKRTATIKSFIKDAQQILRKGKI